MAQADWLASTFFRLRLKGTFVFNEEKKPVMSTVFHQGVNTFNVVVLCGSAASLKSKRERNPLLRNTVFP
jgi:hypothetical protein